MQFVIQAQFLTHKWSMLGTLMVYNVCLIELNMLG